MATRTMTDEHKSLLLDAKQKAAVKRDALRSAISITVGRYRVYHFDDSNYAIDDTKDENPDNSRRYFRYFDEAVIALLHIRIPECLPSKDAKGVLDVVTAVNIAKEDILQTIARMEAVK